VNLHGWINAYLDHLLGERGLAKNTVQAYSLDLAALAAHLGEDRDPSTIRTSAIASLQASNVARGLSAKSSARQLSAIRGLFRFLVREGAIAKDPSLPIARPKRSRAKRLPSALSIDEVLRLLGAPDRSTDLGACHAAMLQLMYASGLRVTELCGLRLSDLDQQRGLVVVHAEGRRHRLVPVGTVALRHIRHYLTEVRPSRGPGGTLQTALFPSPRGGHYTREAFWQIVRRYAAAAGIVPLPSPQKLRHSFASHLLQRGAELHDVQALLGHAHLSTTALYAHVSPGRPRAAQHKSQPRAR
jgi:integrase/recombinase XerD